MTRTLLVSLCLFAGTVIAGVLLFFRPQPEIGTDPGSANPGSLTPIEADTKAVVSDRALPQGAIAVDLASVAELEPPFALAAQAGAVGGTALVLPKGTRDKDRSSRARIPFNVDSAGTFSVWLRVFWRDGCGNSVFAKLGDAQEKTIGHDELFNAWHWIPVGEHNLAAGTHELILREREDGIAVDQLLLVRDKDFLPTGRVERTSFTRSVRRFADDFTRSPGHGIGGWERVSGKFEILFSFDPNRIPLQYAFGGEPTGETPALALVKGPPWSSARLAFSVFPTKEGTFGVRLDRSADGKEALRLDFSLSTEKAGLHVSGRGADLRTDLSCKLRLNQWHALIIERWAWVLTIYLDEQKVLTCTDLPTPMGDIGFSVTSGAAVFDDVKLEEMPWQADDGKDHLIVWQPATGAKWFRHAHAENGNTLLGQNGGIATALPPLSVEAVLLDEHTAGPCTVDDPGLTDSKTESGPRLLHRRPFAKTGEGVTLTPRGEGEAELRRVAVAYREAIPEQIVIGPYTFSSYRIEDPSDYVDFTPEEHQQMRNLPDAEKLRRGEKPKRVIGDRSDDNSPWYTDRGYWRVRNGYLEARGPAILSYADAFGGAFEMRFKVRLEDAGSVAQIFLCGEPRKRHRIRFVAGAPKELVDQDGRFYVQVGSTATWHEVRLRVENRGVSVALDRGAWRLLTDHRTDSGFVAIGTPTGRVRFDDIEFVLPRVSPDGRNYGFMQAEADWWRSAQDGAKWIDHNGISCRLASSWITLVAPKGRGYLWNKHTFGSDIAIATDITENSEWYGWDRGETHIHYPYDNICLAMGSECDETKGYRLEVNSQNRALTVLYRNDKPVARVRQTYQFPMRYVGGHAPYFPRRNRVGMIKRGNTLTVLVNEINVLTYTDPEPLPVSRIGLGGYDTHINFGPIHVREIEQE